MVSTYKVVLAKHGPQAVQLNTSLKTIRLAVRYMSSIATLFITIDLQRWWEWTLKLILPLLIKQKEGVNPLLEGMHSSELYWLSNMTHPKHNLYQKTKHTKSYRQD